MSLFTIPTRNDLPWYTFTISIANVLYTFHMRYNVRSERWILDICDPADNQLLVGLPILIERNIAGQYVISGIPPGTFAALDNTGNENQPTLSSFNNTHTLYYLDPLP